MLLSLKSKGKKLVKSKDKYEFLVDLVAAVGLGITIYMQKGNHSILHEALAIAYYFVSLGLVLSKRPYRNIYIFLIIIIFIVALLTDGFW